MPVTDGPNRPSSYCCRLNSSMLFSSYYTLATMLYWILLYSSTLWILYSTIQIHTTLSLPIPMGWPVTRLDALGTDIQLKIQRFIFVFFGLFLLKKTHALLWFGLFLVAWNICKAFELEFVCFELDLEMFASLIQYAPISKYVHTAITCERESYLRGMPYPSSTTSAVLFNIVQRAVTPRPVLNI